MISGRLYQFGDASAISPKSVFIGEGFVIQKIELWAKSRNSRMSTILKDGRPIAIVGINRIWGNSWELWAFIDESISSGNFGFARYCKYLLESIVAVAGVRRLHGTCVSSFKQGCRFFKFLGFEKEVTLTAYGPNGEDYFQYARIFQ